MISQWINIYIEKPEMLQTIEEPRLKSQIDFYLCLSLLTMVLLFIGMAGFVVSTAAVELKMSSNKCTYTHARTQTYAHNIK